VPPAVAPAITVHCTDRTFLERQTQLLEGPLESLALFGLPPSLRDSEEACATYRMRFSGLPPTGLIDKSTSDQLPLSTMQVPDAKRLIYDSAKLACLDTLLQELKAGDHRVLIYFQMTRMMDLMEEYLIYRQFKYLRLDGSSKLEDRRDMVIDWQTRSAKLNIRPGGVLMHSSDPTSLFSCSALVLAA
jgi:chromatin-remodeling ATPase INO80